jgi:hypothetical protein
MLTLQHSETSTETYMFAQISDEQIRQYHGTHGHMAEAHYQLVAILGANDNTHRAQRREKGAICITQNFLCSFHD